MNYHLFDARLSHLAPNILIGIFKYAHLIHNNWKKEIFIYIWVPRDLLFGDKETELKKYKSVFEEFSFHNYKFIERNLNMLRMIFGINVKNDILIIHSNYTFFKKKHLFFLLLASRGKSFLNRVVKIEWGVNSYQLSETMKKKVFFFIEKYIYNHLKFVVTLSPVDKIITESKYPKAKVIHANYLLPSDNRYNKNPKRYNSEKPLKIFVSHSGHTHNNHFKTFELLNKFSIENIEIMCPLCYGPKKYIEQVITKGNEIFGNKFNHFTQLKPIDQYVKLIAEHDIYVTSATIQTGLFAAFTALSNGLKIYLGDNLLKFLHDLDYIVYDINEINELNLKDISKPLPKSAFLRNQELYSNQINDEKLINTWGEIYSTEKRTEYSYLKK